MTSGFEVYFGPGGSAEDRAEEVAGLGRQPPERSLDDDFTVVG